MTGGTVANIIGSAGKSDSSGNSFVDPTQKGYLNDLFRRASQLAGQSAFVGFDPFQLQGQQSAADFAQGINPFIQNVQNTSSFLTNPNLLNPGSNPFLAQSAQAAINPLLKSLTEDILPQIGADAVGTGNFNSSRKGVGQGIAVDRFLGQAGDISSNIFSNAYGQGLNTLTQNLGLAPSIANLGLLPSSIYSNIGAERRGLLQEQALEPFNSLSRYQSLLGSPIVLNQNKSKTRSGISSFGGLGKEITGGLKSLGSSLGL